MKITFYVFLSLKHYIDIVIDYMHNICYIQIALKNQQCVQSVLVGRYV